MRSSARSARRGAGGGAGLRRTRRRGRDRRQRDARPDLPDGAEGVAAGGRLGAPLGVVGDRAACRGVYDQHVLGGHQRASVGALKARGVKVLVVVQRSPAWASRREGGIAPADGPGHVRRVHGRAGGAPAGRRRMGDLERARRGRVLPRRARPGAVRGAAARGVPGDQGRAAGGRRRDGRHGRQRHGLPRAALPARRAGRLRRGRGAHRHGMPHAGPRPPLSRRAWPGRPLHVLRLSRGPRGDGGPRRRREADLDDGDRLGHAFDAARLVQHGYVGGPEAARRVPAAPGQVPQGRLPLCGGRRVRRARLLVRHAGHPRGRPRARVRALPPRRQGQAVRARVPQARARHQAAPRLRRRCRPHAADDPGRRAGRRPALLGKLSVRVRAWDNPGGTGLQRIYLEADGRHVLTWGGSGGSLEPWWATADWRRACTRCGSACATTLTTGPRSSCGSRRSAGAAVGVARPSTDRFATSAAAACR